MKRHLASLAIVVRDYDEAIAFYTAKMGFVLVEDTEMGGGKRFVRLAPSESAQTTFVLARAVGEEQISHIGNQSGGRVFLFLQTDDFDRDYEAMRGNGVIFCEAPRQEIYGKVVVFLDLYGNKWDLVEPVAEMN